ncbi:hypothetical protein [Photobacterium nomapromontoriensis]|uniref:hypothetical protein n=1 Tax=Photobacterium nomapromontoriensis TaxID=2910237 RepID=UPI003D12AD2C
MKWYSWLTLMVFVSACTSQANVDDIASQQSQFVKGECGTNSVHSLTDTFNQFMADRQEELNILRTELSAENYKQLEYALEHFVSYWDQLQVERNVACKQNATCQFFSLKNPERYANNDFCDGVDFEYSVSRAKIINFFNDIERLQLQKSSQ